MNLASDAWSSSTVSSVPVLLIVFNRPEMVELQLKVLRSLRPKNIFVAGDGPRHGNERDAEQCEAVRLLVESIDWECNLRLRWNRANLGVNQSVPSAISWAFEEADELIILEDDCLPDPTFFDFCARILERYRENSRIMMVTGHNRQGEWLVNESDYFFCHTGGIWGWATWKDRWEVFDPELRGLERLVTSGYFRQLLGPMSGQIREQMFWANQVNCLTSWDYAWAFSRNSRAGLAVVPSTNLVQNLGFGEAATNTRRSGYHAPVRKLSSKTLIGPTEVEPDLDYDRLFLRRSRIPRRYWPPILVKRSVSWFSKRMRGPFSG